MMQGEREIRERTICNKLLRFFIYVIVWHFVRIGCEIFLPNAHVFNRIRGSMLGLFFKSRGRRLSLASGCIINAPWNLDVGADVYFAHRVWINASGGLSVESGVVVSPNVVIATTAHDRENGVVSMKRSKLAPIVIERGAWIASNSVVTRGSRIGVGAVVGAGSVVVGEVTPGSFFAGNPARFIRPL